MNRKKIILFDGVCNFCNFWVNFIIDRDFKDSFRFAALQSENGQELLEKIDLDKNLFDTFILVDEDKVFTKSTAAFKISKELGGIWKYLYLLIIIPKPIRDLIYSIIADNRYKFFGKRDACRIPTEEERKKFLS